MRTPFFLMIPILILLNGCALNNKQEAVSDNNQKGMEGVFVENDQSQNPDTETLNADEIDVNTIAEETFSEQELKAYYASYADPFVLHIRKALNGYMDGTNYGIEIPKAVIESRTEGNIIYGLSSFNKSYYKSKFIVWQIDQSIGGGKEITLIFQDKPDKIFHAWIYELGDEKKYDLRGFWEDTESSKGIKILLKAYGKYILDKKHNL